MTECLIDDAHFIRQGEVESRCWCLGDDTCGVVPCVLFRARANLGVFACLGGTRELQCSICGARWSLAQHVPLTKPCLADDVTRGSDYGDDDGLSCVVGQTVEIHYLFHEEITMKEKTNQHSEC